MYPSDWHNFFDQFLELIQTNTVNGNKTNIRVADIFLRILISIDDEVANIEIQRGKEQANRNTAIVCIQYTLLLLFFFLIDRHINSIL